MTVSRVIDADGHVNEPPVLEQFLDCLRPPYRDRARPSPENPMTLLIDGKVWPPRRKDPKRLVVHGGEALASWHEQPARSGMWDPHRRIRDMDVDRMDVAVLFPGPYGLAAPGHPDPQMAVALALAYNDWLARYCKPFPERLKGVASLPAHDVPASVAELRRCVKELGFVGGMMPNRPPNAQRNLDDPAYEPLWDEAQRLDVPICIHNNAFQMALQERFTFGGGMHSYLGNKPIHDPVENMLAVQALIFGGVLDRFPRLRVAIMEGGVGWIPFWMDRLGEYYEEFLEGTFKRGGPVEYFKSEQLFFSFEVEETTVGYVANVIGPERLLYASDYFHHDAKVPGSVKLVEKRRDLTQEAKNAVLGGNAAVLYGSGVG